MEIGAEQGLERHVECLIESGWSRRVAGIFVSNGITWEWGLLGSDGLPDYSAYATAGVHQYLPGEQIFANTSMVFAHVDQPGTRTVLLPAKSSGVEFFTGRPFDAENGGFAWDFQDKDVCLFLLNE